jgi:hypothetical protein
MFSNDFSLTTVIKDISRKIKIKVQKKVSNFFL